MFKISRQIAIAILLPGLFFSFTVNARDIWRRANLSQLHGAAPAIGAAKYSVYTADEAGLQAALFALPSDPVSAVVMPLPMPDGSMKDFKVWQTPVMPPLLAEKYPGIKTFTAVSVDDAHVTAKLDFTLYGFHAMIFNGDRTSFVDPYDNTGGSGYYMVHYKTDELRSWTPQAKCEAIHQEPVTVGKKAIDLSQKAYRTVNGTQLRTYRLALACSHQYANAATGLPNPSVAQVLSKMITSLNRVNGVYERELSVTMNLVAKEDTLIFNADVDGPNGIDPFSSVNDNAQACLFTNQTLCDSRIGAANYDVGHVFTSGAGGLSLIGVVCLGGSKAQSVTGQSQPVGDGFDIDYVAHEMGHEYGADHPFNSSDGNCGGGNINESTAYEPGSGSTIMAYAGICSPDNLQAHSDDYFHAISLLQIQDYITYRTGNTCAVKTPTGNKPVALPAFTATYNIPYLTPFELTAPAATDSVADTSVTYCWEEWDLGNSGEELDSTHAYGPIFRSYRPVKTTVRVFPKDTMVLAGILSNAGHDFNEGEKVPDVARKLAFRLTVRDIYNGDGCFLVPDDSIVLHAINTGKGFSVTSQNDSGAIYIGGFAQTITWNVANTSSGPINASYVDIYMSDDGGYTWRYQIGTFPNTGSVSVPLPNPPSDIAAARIKVKGSGNVFFNVNKYNFAVAHSDSVDTAFNFYPNPAHSVLRIYTGDHGTQKFAIYNAAGKLMHRATVYGIYDVPVSNWPRGLYIIRLEGENSQHNVKKFIVE